jgi:hypothetical protein
MGPFEVKSLLRVILSACDQTRTVETNLQQSNTGFMSLVPRDLTISVKSEGHDDGNMCQIKINDDVIVSPGDRGLNVLVLSGEDGTIVESASFDTHISKEESEDFARLIETLEPGSVVVVAAKDDCSEQLTEAARLACESLGSKQVRNIKYRSGWCLVATKTTADTLAKFTTDETMSLAGSGQSHELKAKVPFDHSDDTTGNDGNNPAMTLPLLLSTLPRHTIKLIMPNKGHWYRRRKIDGCLQRTPSYFYPKVHKILERSVAGIAINGTLLPRDPVSVSRIYRRLGIICFRL